jgi:hypothetical protein
MSTETFELLRTYFYKAAASARKSITIALGDGPVNPKYEDSHMERMMEISRGDWKKEISTN